MAQNRSNKLVLVALQGLKQTVQTTHPHTGENMEVTSTLVYKNSVLKGWYDLNSI